MLGRGKRGVVKFCLAIVGTVLVQLSLVVVRECTCGSTVWAVMGLPLHVSTDYILPAIKQWQVKGVGFIQSLKRMSLVC